MSIRKAYANPDSETESLSPSGHASTCRVRGNLIVKGEIPPQSAGRQGFPRMTTSKSELGAHKNLINTI
jgi:hypothetical protein